MSAANTVKLRGYGSGCATGYPVDIPTTPSRSMNPLDEYTIYCPYCGESQDVLIDAQEAGQQYIEDCQVCCQPINFHIHTGQDRTLEVTVTREDDA